MIFADAHCHLQDTRLRGAISDILGACRGNHIQRWIVNSTRESDWESVSSLCNSQSGLHPAYGLHPWWIRERTPEWEIRLEKRLHAEPLASIGETGLDLWMQEADLEDQTAVLAAHLRLAYELDRPVSLHCLRAWPQLLKIITHSPPLPAGFLLHSFAGPRADIPRWVALGAYFSFSPAFVAPKRTAIRSMYANEIPLDRLLVETDCPDMAPSPEFCKAQVPSGPLNACAAGERPLNHPLNLLVCIESLARDRRMDPHSLQAVLWKNFCTLWPSAA